MKCFLWLLFCFTPCISIGQDKLSISKVDIDFLAVRKAINSLVTVAVPTNPGKSQFNQPLISNSSFTPSLQDESGLKKPLIRLTTPPPTIETTGFIARDTEGNIGVIAGFHLIDKAVQMNKEKFLVVYNNANRGFPVKEIKNISPESNLVFLMVEGDLTEKGERPPLSLAGSYNENDLLFYTSRVSLGGLWFRTRVVKDTISTLKREDFVIPDTYRNTSHSAEVIGKPVTNQTPVINQKGEVVSFASDGSEHTLYGVPLQDLKEFLNSSKDCSRFLRGCVIEARKALYREAKSRNSKGKAMYMLIASVRESFKAFEEFMHSIEINDPDLIKKEQELFWKGATEWNAELYYHWTMHNEDLSKKEKQEHFRFLIEKSPTKILAERGHPHFQYLLGSMYFYLEDESQTEYWLNKSAKSGYIPGLWMKMNWNLARSFGKLTVLAEHGYAPAKKTLALINHDLNEAKNFLNAKKQLIPHFPKIGHSRGFIQHTLDIWRKDVSPAVDETSTFESSVLFSESANQLTASLDLLKQLVELNYTPAKKMQDLLERSMLQRNWKLHTYPLSTRLHTECEKTLATYFVSEE